MRRFLRGTIRILDVIYVMFFGAGDRWSVWIIVMAMLGALFLTSQTDRFTEAPTRAELVFLAVFIGISGIGVYVRRKRKEEE
jgi:hypothetical protein